MYDLNGRLASARPIFLDGPVGTALEARGFRSHPPLWTARAAESDVALLGAVHDDHLRAGAELITANTFRTTAFAARQAGLAEPEATARRWLFATVALAREHAAAYSGRAVLGSLAPLADCYTPADTPDDGVLKTEHGRTAAWLVEAGSDGILVETQGSGREARLAVRSAVQAAAGRLPVLVSFLPAPSGTRLFDGSDLRGCAEDCLAGGAAALLVNCAHVDVLLQALAVLAPLGERGVPLGAYPNAAKLEIVDGKPRWQADPQRDLAAAGRRLRRAGARIIGACCGFLPEDCAALYATLSSRASAETA